MYLQFSMFKPACSFQCLDHGKKAVNKLEIFITIPQGEPTKVLPWVIYYTAR